MRRSVPCKYKFKSDSLSEDNYRVDLECGGTDQQEDAEFLAEAKAKALCESKLSLNESSFSVSGTAPSSPKITFNSHP